MLAVDSGMAELPGIGSGIGLGIGAGAAMAIVLDGMCRVNNALLFCFDALFMCGEVLELCPACCCWGEGAKELV